jgi:hypothetical protein
MSHVKAPQKPLAVAGGDFRQENKKIEETHPAKVSSPFHPGRLKQKPGAGATFLRRRVKFVCLYVYHRIN